MEPITTLVDIHQDIIQTHILPRLNYTISSYLRALCSDDDLWDDIAKSAWPSITHPSVDNVISTFPAGHRSFFEDSYPLLITNVNYTTLLENMNITDKYSTSLPSAIAQFSSSETRPLELISAVDIRYQSDILLSTVEFTNTTTDYFLSSTLVFDLINNDQLTTGNTSGISLSVGSKTGDIIGGADEATLSHLKESVTLSWILINPTTKRACNLSSIKPVSASAGWMTNETILRFMTVFPGCDPDEMVECRIEVVLGGVCEGGEGLHVEGVIMKIVDMDSNCLNGGDFLVITQGASSEENNVTRKVVDHDEERLESYKEYKKIRKEKRAKMEKFKNKMSFVGIWCILMFVFISQIVNLLN